MKILKEHMHLYDVDYKDIGILTIIDFDGELVPAVLIDDMNLKTKINNIEDCREVFKLFIEKYNGDNNDEKKK